MKTIAIGDIHGCIYSLLDLLDELKNELKTCDNLVFLGDYTDRGIHSFNVLDFLSTYKPEKINTVFLKGNHEVLFINGSLLLTSKSLDPQYLDDFTLWAEHNGGRSTILDFKENNARLDRFIEWQKNLPLYFETPYFYYAHAGIPYMPIETNMEYDFVWERNHTKRRTKPEGSKRVIFGHTPADEPYYTKAGDLCIDTGCTYGGFLTAVVTEDDKITEFYKVPRSEFDVQ